MYAGSNQNIVCTIEARMTSSRLPGRVLLPLAGKPLLISSHRYRHFYDKVFRMSLISSNINNERGTIPLVNCGKIGIKDRHIG